MLLLVFSLSLGSLMAVSQTVRAAVVRRVVEWYETHIIGDRPVDIAARLSVHHTTIYKELQRGATGTLDANQREGYSAELAERRLRESFKRRGKRAPAAQ